MNRRRSCTGAINKGLSRQFAQLSLISKAPYSPTPFDRGEDATALGLRYQTIIDYYTCSLCYMITMYVYDMEVQKRTNSRSFRALLLSLDACWWWCKYCGGCLIKSHTGHHNGSYMRGDRAAAMKQVGSNGAANQSLKFESYSLFEYCCCALYNPGT